jgi:PPOX class probable F420-dependent enzyme
VRQAGGAIVCFDVQLPPETIEAILAHWAVADLATAGADGRPHVVPVVFAHVDGVLWSPIDGKPKLPARLARVRNIERDARVTLLLDHYQDDWNQLWWIRIDGRATLVPGDAGAEAALRAKYPQYRSVPLYAAEPLLIRIEPTQVTTWGRDP